MGPRQTILPIFWWKCAALLLSRLAAGDGAQFLTARDVLEMATRNSARLLGGRTSDALHPGTLQTLLQSMQSALK